MKSSLRQKTKAIKNKIMYNSIVVGAFTTFSLWSMPTVYADNASSIFKHQGGVTKEQMETGQKLGSPLFNVIGISAGCIFSFIVAWQVLQTAVDLLYLYVPFLRGLLSPNQDPQAQGGVLSSMTTISDDMQKALELNGSNLNQNAMGAGGMQGGMGGGMAGGMGMGGMSGGMGMNRGMGMGMGGMSGGMGMGGMDGMTNPSMGNMPFSKKNTALTYFKNRALSLILLMVCIGVLASSILTDSGINLAELVMKILSFLNNGLEDKISTILFWSILI